MALGNPNTMTRANSLGPSTKRVSVIGLDSNGVALVKDTLGKEFNVPYDVVRAKGALSPSPGEIWMVDQTLGFWAFAALIGNPRTTLGSLEVTLAGQGTGAEPQFGAVAPTYLALRSPSGVVWKVTVDDTGVLHAAALPRRT